MDRDRESRIRQRAYTLWEEAGHPDGEHDAHWRQAEREIEKDGGEIPADDLPRLGALREAAREHTDAFLVETDMEDAVQREAPPGTKDQP